MQPKRLNVLMTGPQLTDQPGGIQTHVQNFIKAFASYDKVRLSFFSSTLGLYNAERWVNKATRFIISLPNYIHALRQCDVVHINSTFDNRSVIRDSIYLAIATRLFHRPVVLQFHGGFADKPSIIQKPLFHRVLNHLWSKRTSILILSKIQASSFTNVFPRLSYTLVPNYIECSQIAGNRQAPNLEERPFHFIFIGRIDRAKGVPEIIEAARILTNRKQKYCISLYGNGPLAEWTNKVLAESENDFQNIHYLGPVYGAAKESVLAQADAILLPSTHAEGFPYSLLEAGVHQLPMIATPVGAIPEIIKDGETGFLVKPNDPTHLADCMTLMIQSPKIAWQMGINMGNKIRLDYSFEKLVTDFHNIYQHAS